MNTKKRGFTLIELLSVVVILGIIAVISIVSVNKLINRSKRGQLEQQKNMVLIAAKSYAQNNRIVLPKSIGETSKIKLDVLKSSGYLKQDVKNANDEDCMIESFVKITKTSATKYKYEAFLYCGNEKAPKEEEKEKPVVKIKFVDDNGDIADYDEVAVARFNINIKGSASRDIAIDSYSYIIMTDTGKKNKLEEAYNSGTLSGNNLYEINIDKLLKDYIDITRATKVKIKVTVLNADGGLIDETTTLGEKGITYNDDVDPKCIDGKSLNEANEDEWINKKDFLSEGKTRTITVFCEDGKGSGCVRDSFVRTWPNKTIKSARYGYIQIKDNAGNKNIDDTFETQKTMCQDNLYNRNISCVVRVNVDVVAPIIEVEAYRNSSKKIEYDKPTITGSNMIKNEEKKKTNSDDDTGILKYNEYEDTPNDWMNFKNYENGVIYKVTLKDDLHLIDWKWETNVDELDNIEDPKYEELSVDNADGHVLEKIPDDKPYSKNCGCTEKVIYVGFTKNGKRKGKLTVTDIAGNTTTFVIEANLDRLVPQTPEVKYYYDKNNKNYDKLNEWWKENVKTHVKSVGEIGVSGYDRFEYLYYNDSKTKVKEENKDKCKKMDMDCFKFLADGNNEGKNYVKYRTCDVADNCSEYSNDKFADGVWIDTKPPEEMKVTGYKKINTNEATSNPGYGTVASGNWFGGYLDNDNEKNKVEGIVVIADSAKDKHSQVKYYLTSKSSNIGPGVSGTVKTESDIKAYWNENTDGSSYKIYFRSCDLLDNCSSVKSFEIKLDKSPPTGISVSATSIPTGINNITQNKWFGACKVGSGKVHCNTTGNTKLTGMTVTAKNATDRYSGKESNGGVITYIRGTKDNFKPIEKRGSSSNVYNVPYKSSGTYTDYFRACDPVGNCGNTVSYKSLLDIDAPSNPTVTGSSPSQSLGSGKWYSDYPVTVRLTGGEERSTSSNSGTPNNHYHKNKSTTAMSENKVTVDGDTTSSGVTYTFNSCDNVGNCSSGVSYIVKIDSKKPQCSFSLSATVDKGVSGSVGCTDTISGCETSTQSISNLKSYKQLSIKDNAGNVNLCTINVTSREEYKKAKYCCFRSHKGKGSLNVAGKELDRGTATSCPSGIDGGYYYENCTMSATADGKTSCKCDQYNLIDICDSEGYSGSYCGWPTDWSSTYCSVQSDVCKHQTVYEYTTN